MQTTSFKGNVHFRNESCFFIEITDISSQPKIRWTFTQTKQVPMHWTMGQVSFFTIVLATEDLDREMLSIDKRFCTKRRQELRSSGLWIILAPCFRARAPWLRPVPACGAQQTVYYFDLLLPVKLSMLKWRFVQTGSGPGAFLRVPQASDSQLSIR